MEKKMFVKTLLLSFLILAVCSVSFSKENKIESLWTDSALIIDGLDDEWADSSLNYEKKIKVHYAFKNDANNLYVLFVFEDPEYISAIRGTGMTIWLNTEGKKKKKYGINFKTKQVTADTLISTLEKRHGSISDDEKKKIKSGQKYFLYHGEVIDKKDKILTDSALGGEIEVPLFKSKQKQSMRIYEFRVPLRILEKLSSGQRMEPGKMVKVGFEWGGLTEAMKLARLKRLSESGSRGPETTSIGISSSDASRERDLERSSRTRQSTRGTQKKYSFWVDVALAQI